jgi:hypothetical protein
MNMTDLGQTFISLFILNSCYVILTTPLTMETYRTILFEEHHEHHGNIYFHIML